MSTTDTHTIAPTLYPWLRYADAPAAIAWLQRAFGFELLMRTDSPDGAVAHAELALGSGILMLGSEGDGERSAAALPAVSGGVYVYVADVDAHCARARAAGATITREPNDTHYGSREYCARDLEGHHWAFGTYRPAPPR